MAPTLVRGQSDSSVLSPPSAVQDAPIPEGLKRVGVLETIWADPRPTFILDLEDLQVQKWRTVYTNPACVNALSETVVVREDDASGPFRRWASDLSDERPRVFRHNSKLWTCFELRKRWRILSGTAIDGHGNRKPSVAAMTPAKTPPQAANSSPLSPTFSLGTVGAAFVSGDPSQESWESLLPDTAYVNDLFKTNDWSKTSLGPMKNWPYLLRRSTRFILADPSAACLFWGADRACIFNAAYADILGPRQYESLGQPASVVWSEIYDQLEVYIAEVSATRQACSWHGLQFIIERAGAFEETYWDWSLIPLMEDRGKGSGFYSSIYEVTRQVLSDRRQDTMLAPIHARDAPSFWAAAQYNFSKNPWDAPFAAFYDVSQARRLSSESTKSDHGCYCVLRSTIGITGRHPALPFSADLSASTTGVMPYLLEATTSEKPLILTSGSHRELFDMVDDVEWQGFGHPCHTMVVFCLRLGTEIIGFIILGLNPRRPHNDDEQRFLNTLDSQLSASLSAATLIERARATETRLQDQLAMRIEQVEMSDSRYRAITELSPLGMINLTPEGETVYANKMWFDITGHPPEADLSKVSFRTIIVEEDLPLIDQEFHEMVVNKQKRYYEIRLKKQWFDKTTREWENCWLLCTGGPECDSLGNVRSIIGCITDISVQKHAEVLQSRSRQAAEEAKASQERYMDVTSHEMRNPLSAILQSADDILSSLKDVAPEIDGRCLLAKSAIDSCVDAAGIVSLCAQHQARIINDVLTLSKLDSKLLEVTPVPAQPIAVVRETLQMYNPELVSNDISVELSVESSFTQHRIDALYCDPARLKQVLINLMGNAIKFTRQEKLRKITVSLAASLVRPPTSQIGEIEWFPSERHGTPSRRDLTRDPEWGNGEQIYVAVLVSDTGKGLTEEEKKNKLFNRFAQANTLTHVHYGGSGLGLFISRELTEMQGGEIGVASKVGKGTCFAFYIKGRRAISVQPNMLDDRESLGGPSDKSEKTPTATSDQPQHTAGVVPLMPSTIQTEPAAVLKKTKLQILLVEDNVVNQKVMTKQLVKAGAQVVVANHGQEALDCLRKSTLWEANEGIGDHFDLALMDIEMPVMNGLICSRNIREMQAQGKLTAHVPIIAVTANARKEQIDECLAAGMDDFMIKPFRIPDLLAKAEKLLSGKKWATPNAT